MQLPRRLLHPISVKLLRQGHPWVTLDGFSRRFPIDAPFIQGLDDRERPVGILLHDPQHPYIRGRLWSTDPHWSADKLWEEIEFRLIRARERRASMPSFTHRENRFWVFGESEDLPGLMLLQLGDQWILQYYALRWVEWASKLVPLISRIFNFSPEHLWWQIRAANELGQVPPIPWLGPPRKMVFPLEENGVKMLVRLGESYDYGIYTDMAAIRLSLSALFARSPRVLNLYAYTGAFSLAALRNNAQNVVSVDLSGKYLAHLQENLEINDPAWKTKHESLVMSAEAALEKLVFEKRQFDLIISDPPSMSSDGQKRSSALQAYEKQWNNFLKLLTPTGSLLTFLNTHAVSFHKFQKHLHELPSNRSLKISARYRLLEDCPTIKGFHEGDYLKGILWK